MKHVVVENGVVENIVEGAIEGGIPVEEGVFCVIGAEYHDGVFVVPAPAPINYTVVSRKQGLVALFELEGITEQDVLGAISAIEDPAVQYRAQLEFASGTWEIHNAYVQMLAGSLNISGERLQVLFNEAQQY